LLASNLDLLAFKVVWERNCLEFLSWKAMGLENNWVAIDIGQTQKILSNQMLEPIGHNAASGSTPR
jgi:hypothetical protein